MKVTRRALGAAVLAAPAAAQAPAPSDDDLLKQAREQRRKNAGKLADYKVPMEAEPAFRFQP